jgi:hypothetical protein
MYATAKVDEAVRGVGGHRSSSSMSPAWGLRQAARSCSNSNDVHERGQQPNFLFFALLVKPGPLGLGCSDHFGCCVCPNHHDCMAMGALLMRVRSASLACRAPMYLGIIACVSFFSYRHHPPPHPLHRPRPSGAELKEKKRVT